MKCSQVQQLLVFYLDHECAPSERALIQAHLSGCPICQNEVSRLSIVQEQIGSALQRRAATAVPPQDAWSRLETQLTQVQLPAPSVRLGKRSCKAPCASLPTMMKPFSGGIAMQKRLILAASLVVLAVAIAVGISLFNRVTPVSARVVLDRAYRVQMLAAPVQGIEHIRTETYSNPQGLAADQGMDTIVESYHDLQTGNTRLVTIDQKTGKVLNVFAYDGTYTYSQNWRNASDPLTVYRSPQSQVSKKEINPGANDNAQTMKAWFDQMRNSPNVQLVGQETWEDGRSVYVLRSEQEVKLQVSATTEHSSGIVIVYFDVHTYEILGNKVTITRDGQEIVLSTSRTIVNETLPAVTQVAWDLSDLSGIQIVDDPNGTQGDLLPEVITPQDLASKTQSGYLLKTTPAGFSLEISAPPRQSLDKIYIYIASYTDEANDLFVIQASGPDESGAMLKQAVDTYTTASGLVVHFMDSTPTPDGKTFIDAVVEAPDGVTFMITSNLPLDTVKAWSEDLVLVK